LSLVDAESADPDVSERLRTVDFWTDLDVQLPQLRAGAAA
jgi:hypothetical protein